MGTSRKDLATGGERFSGVDYVLLFIDTSGVVVWFIVVGHVGGNYEDIGGESHIIPLKFHRE